MTVLMEASIVATLSPRERQVLGLVAKGRTSKQIARELRIAIGTVTVTSSRAVHKLGCDNRAQACVVATRLGLIEDVSKLLASV